MENKNKLISEDKKFEYVFLYRAYLITAHRNIDEVLKKITKNKYRNPFGELIPDWVYECNILMFPAMFNLKHGIEMFLKTTRHFLDLNEIRDKNGHDLKFIFKKTELELKKIFEEKTVKELERIILKYHEINFNGIKISDSMNTFFRFGEHANCFEYFSEIKKEDLLLIKRELKEIDQFFYETGEAILKLKFGPYPSPEDLILAKSKYLESKK